MVHLDLERLRSFVACAQAGSFSGAAASVGLPPARVRLQMRRLEATLGQQLFRRSRPLVLTRHGEVLLSFARRMLDLNDEGVRLLTASGLSGTVRLGVSEYFMPLCLPQLVARFARAYPQLVLDVRVGTTAALRRSLEAGALDAVIGRREGRAGSLVFREPLCWAGRRGTTLERSEVVSLVALPQGCGYRAAAIALLERAGRSWRLVYEGAGLQGVQAAAAAGLGVACLPLSAIQRSLRVMGTAEGLPALPDSEIVLYERSNVTDTGLARLVEVLRASLPRLSAEAMTDALSEAA